MRIVLLSELLQLELVFFKHFIVLLTDFFLDLLPLCIPISVLNNIFADLVSVQNAPKRQSQLLIISHCFSESDANFMQIANSNMYMNLFLHPGV